MSTIKSLSEKKIWGIVIVLMAIIVGTNIFNYTLISDSANRIATLEASNLQLEESLQNLAALTGHTEEMGESYLMELALNASKEKSLVIYTGHSAEVMSAYVNLFTKRYPFLDVSFVRRNSITLSEKFKSEAAVDRWEADLILLEDFLVVELIEEGLMQPYLVQGKDKEKFDQDLCFDPDAYWMIASANGRGMSVNYEAFPDESLWPKKYTDWVNPRPEWKGKVIIVDPRLATTSYFSIWGVYDKYGIETLQEVVEGLRQSDVFIASSASVGRGKVASGEYYIYWSDNAYSARYFQKIYNAPLKYYPSEDMNLIGLKYFAMPRKLSHPNAAKLFLEWSITDEAQKFLLDWGFVGTKEGIEPPPGMETYPDIPKVLVDAIAVSEDREFLCDKFDEWLGR